MSLIVAILLILYIIWDVNYCVRLVFTVLARCLVQRKRKITEKTIIYGLCTPQDFDIFFGHMNNARYLRELDFARFHYYGLTGLTEVYISAVQAASNIRYRRFIPVFIPYRVETSLVWWDDKTMYLEHEFITLHDNFVRAVAMSKQVVKDRNVTEMLAKFPEGKSVPSMPEDVKMWIEAMQISSQQLRKDK